ncbi:hypothetical protein [Empedobacter brevis]|uniref:hypothetical protein n=1 Tax=Empedobacter brevis TaxID=247 RepID=UPI0023F39DBE|nr:hypothetical protein [Empedobacter brevis]
MEFRKRLIYFVLFFTVIYLVKTLLIKILLIFNVSFDNYIDIISIFVNVLIAFYFSFWLQNRINNTKANKDFFINEIKDLRLDYKLFIDEINSSRLTKEQTLIRFKDFTMRIEAMKDIFINYYDELNTVLNEHINIRTVITSSNDFNNNFDRNTILEIRSQSLKSNIRRGNKSLIKSIYNVVVNVNNK